MKSILRSIATSSLLLLGMGVAQAQQYWILGGQSATEGQFPWLADIRYGGEHGCGGSLIAPQWVLTAAHCLVDFTPSQISIRLNSINTSGALNPNGGVQVNVEAIYPHPGFLITQDIGDGNDVGLIKLASPVNNISPIAMANLADSTSLYEANSALKVGGWGLTQGLPSPIFPDTLQWVNSKVYDFAICNANNMNLLSTNLFCLGYTQGEDPSGAGAGDSGGPAWKEINGDKVLIGLTSGGDKEITAVDTPGYFTKVAAYRPWIDSVMATGTSIPKVKPSLPVNLTIKSESAVIQFGNMTDKFVMMQIIDMNGRVVKQQKVYNPSNTTVQMDLSAVTNGMFVIKFNSEGGQQLVKKVYKY